MITPRSPSMSSSYPCDRPTVSLRSVNSRSPASLISVRQSAPGTYAPARFAPVKFAARRFAANSSAPAGLPRQVRPRQLRPQQFRPLQVRALQACTMQVRIIQINLAARSYISIPRISALLQYFELLEICHNPALLNICLQNFWVFNMVYR